MTASQDDISRHYTYKEKIFEALKKEPYANFLGMELTDLGPGTAKAVIRTDERMLNGHGSVHGAVIFALADYVFAAACNSYGRTAVGLSTTVNFMAAGAKGAELTATAEEVKRNYKTSWYHINVESEDGLIAEMTATAYRKAHYFVSEEA